MRGSRTAQGSVSFYASSETHTWIQKAADLSGLGTDSIRWIPVDSGFRIRTAELREKIETDLAGRNRPFLVVGSARRVSTGAVDPLPELAELLKRVQGSGEVFLSNAIVNGKFALRLCIVNFRTTPVDIEAIPAIVIRLGAEVDTVNREGVSSLRR